MSATPEIRHEFGLEYSAEGSVLKLTGELDLATSGQLLEAYEAWVPVDGGLVLDLTDLTFADSSGLQAMLDIAKRIAPKPLILRQPPAAFRKLLEVTGIENMSGLLVEPTADGSTGTANQK